MPDKNVSLATRVEITKKCALFYEQAGNKDKSRILYQLVGVTVWNRDHARQQLRRRLTQAKGGTQATVTVIDRGITLGLRKYSYDAIKVLQRIWAAARILAASRSVLSC